ncbi:hypothetical protein SADUNF_Sadunf06G0218700 [Salix dunnii]|uniref:Uncharacterized protein n=3 Tax=Salix dunnii TaxID=1413687 RepID=A0A835K2X0_9ROSI|nr:hypothetical protein SADUNF_Sadunf06G0218700 [Salix dunnii]
MGKQKWSAFGPLKRAVKKINFLLSFNFRKWRLASVLSIASSSSSGRTRRLSFNDRTGLHGAIEDVESDHQKYDPVRTFERARSYGSSDEDIDKKADIFIKTFRQQLLMERQGESLEDLVPLPRAEICSIDLPRPTRPIMSTVIPVDDTPSTIIPLEPTSPNSPDEAPAPRRNPPRTRQCPSKFQDYAAYAVRYPVSNYLDYSNLSPSYSAFLSALFNDHEPKNFTEAQSHLMPYIRRVPQVARTRRQRVTLAAYWVELNNLVMTPDQDIVTHVTRVHNLIQQIVFADASFTQYRNQDYMRMTLRRTLLPRDQQLLDEVWEGQINQNCYRNIIRAFLPIQIRRTLIRMMYNWGLPVEIAREIGHIASVDAIDWWRVEGALPRRVRYMF